MCGDAIKGETVSRGIFNFIVSDVETQNNSRRNGFYFQDLVFDVFSWNFFLFGDMVVVYEYS